MRTTDEQVQRLRRERAAGRTIGVAALRAGMHRNTARQYLAGEDLPSEGRGVRTWRTRDDPFEEDWEWLRAKLEEAPELEAKALFEHLCEHRPGRYEEGQVRTLQRRVKRWRAMSGPEREVYFPQEHRPGEAFQTDFTDADELGITIQGQPYRHLLCHVVLPYSNWEWATPCRSESMAALRAGVQAGLFRLGAVAEFHQTDNSTAATHDLRTGKRAFNAEYLAFVRHFGMEPRTIAIGKKNQNGDAESHHRHLKRALKQHLLLRGSRDFESQAAYEEWLGSVLERRNQRRSRRVAEEVAVMRPLTAARVDTFTVLDVRVGPGATIRARGATYSVSTRLQGERVRVHVHEDRIEVYYGGVLQATKARVNGREGHGVDWRDVIGALVRKPGAFRRFRYRDALFPTQTFRRAYERLDEVRSAWSADMNYLQLLKRASETTLAEVEQALGVVLDSGDPPTFERVVKELEPVRCEAPQLDVPPVELTSYDDLIPQAGTEG